MVGRLPTARHETRALVIPVEDRSRFTNQVEGYAVIRQLDQMIVRFLNTRREGGNYSQEWRS